MKSACSGRIYLYLLKLRFDVDNILSSIYVKVGAELLFRVLGCKSKRITVTHKKSLVCSSHVFFLVTSVHLIEFQIKFQTDVSMASSYSSYFLHSA